MPAGRDTILGEFGIADAAVIAQLGSLDLSGEAIDAARWLKTAAYFAAHKDRPSVALSLQAL
jgi:glutathione S-transferase